jgi:hypothetical protein
MQYVDDVITEGLKLTARASNAEALVAAEVEQELAEFVSPSGIDVSTPAIRGKLREEIAARFDAALQADLLKFDQETAAIERGLEAQIAKSRRAPVVRDFLQEIALRMRWQDRTPDELIDAYESTTDEDEPLLTALVERAGAGTYAREFRLAAMDPARKMELDARLERAITARQDARQDVKAVELLATLRTNIQENMFHRGHLIAEAKRSQTRPQDFRVARVRRAS